MKSLHRDSKRRGAVMGGEKINSTADADRYIDRALRHDRALLSGTHDPERSKVRAMGLLAASAMPAAEAGAGGSLASWISKLFGGKGLAGTFTVVAVAGGVTLSTVLLTKSTEPTASPARTQVRQIPSTTQVPVQENLQPAPSVSSVPLHSLEEETPAAKAPEVFSAQKSVMQGQNRREKSGKGESRVPAKGENASVAEQQAKAQPDAEQQSNVRVKMKVNLP